MGQVFLCFFFERLVSILTFYRNALYLLNCKLLLCLATMVLLVCCEFNLNVMFVRIHVCSRIAIPHAAGSDGSFGQSEVGMLQAALANWEKPREG